MIKKNYTKKLWTASPQSIYMKIKEFISRQGKGGVSATQVVMVKDGYAKGVNLVMPIKIPKSYVSMINGMYEDFIIKKLKKHIELESKVIWDIGAHIGYQSFAFASTIGPKGSVVAFEPNPYNIQTFKKNIENNPILAKQIILKSEALSNKNGALFFKMGQSKNDATTSGGYLETATPPLPNSSYEGFSAIKVETVTIDSLISQQEIPVPDIIKIDVEGAELSVLQGGSNFIETHKPILVIEIHTIPMMLYVGEFLEMRGYSIEIIDGDSEVFTKNICAVPIQK